MKSLLIKEVAQRTKEFRLIAELRLVTLEEAAKVEMVQHSKLSVAF